MWFLHYQQVVSSVLLFPQPFPYLWIAFMAFLTVFSLFFTNGDFLALFIAELVTNLVLSLEFL